ncbi:MAG: nitroreductase family protein, partial [Anaerolineae bacterium]|nr:nitroreductase family protein [Anaerolineae bacterium]
MDVLEAIHTRRSVRAFTAEPVPDALLRQVLEAGRASASGGNV